MGIFHEVPIGKRRFAVYVSDVNDGNLAFHVRPSVREGRDGFEYRVGRCRTDLYDKLRGFSSHVGGEISRKPVFMNQTHGVTIRRITVKDEDGPFDADAMVSRDIPLAVMTADCVPLVLVSERHGELLEYAVVHAGRVGLLNGILENTLECLSTCDPETISVFIGPHICSRCYEVSSDILEESRRCLPAVAAESRWGTPAINLMGGVSAVLDKVFRAKQAKVKISCLTPYGVFPCPQGTFKDTIYGWCTYEDPNFFSYRRYVKDQEAATRQNLSDIKYFSNDSEDGRFASVAWVN